MKHLKLFENFDEGFKKINILSKKKRMFSEKLVDISQFTDIENKELLESPDPVYGYVREWWDESDFNGDDYNNVLNLFKSPKECLDAYQKMKNFYYED
jgi:hypothetical protein